MVLLPLLSFSPEGIPGRLLSSSSVLPFVMATHNLLLTEPNGHVLDPLMDLLSVPHSLQLSSPSQVFILSPGHFSSISFAGSISSFQRLCIAVPRAQSWAILFSSYTLLSGALMWPMACDLLHSSYS